MRIDLMQHFTRVLTGRLYAALVLACLCSACTSVFFQPMQKLVRTPADLKLQYEDVALKSSDGVELHAWYLPAAIAARGTILFCHGNAENISTHIGSVHWLPARGYNVLLLDYRGYGRSQGSPTVAGAQFDIDAAHAYLLQRRDIDPNKIVLFGQSLGGALALDYAGFAPRRNQLRAVITDSAFSSYRAIAREALSRSWVTTLFRWPLSAIVSDDYNPQRGIARITPKPVLIIHGKADTIIPPHHAEKLYAAANEPKLLWLLDDIRHIEALTKPGIRDRFVRYLEDALR